MYKYLVEKFNASDDSLKISGFFKKSGDLVNIGELVCCLESSKADIDIEARETGYIYYIYDNGNDIEVGDLLFIISKEEISDFEKFFPKKTQSNYSEFTISKKANDLMIQHNISPKQLNKSIIKESDVLDFLNKNLNSDILDNIKIKNISKAILILGGKGGAKMCIDAIKYSGDYEIIGIIDSELRIGELVSDIPVLGGENLLRYCFEYGIQKITVSFSSLNNLPLRESKIKLLKEIGFQFPNIIHPSALIESSVIIGEGNIVLSGSIIGSCAKVGDYNYINTGSIICHESIVGNNNHLAPNSVLAGRVILGNNTLIGINVSTLNDIKIGSNVIVNNGVAVTKNVQDQIILKS
jgi:sugar O-acyltransferase (sialic acid O-acetyltransferase NeuD family)